MDLNINSVIPYFTQNNIWIDPIDTLQVLYNEGYETSFEYELGDVNQDLIIDILDIVFIIDAILEGNSECITTYLDLSLEWELADDLTYFNYEQLSNIINMMSR